MNTELLSAEDARKMTSTKIITINDINDYVKIMANAGLGFYCQRLEGSGYVVEDSLIEELKASGYNVEIDDKFFKISWL